MKKFLTIISVIFAFTSGIYARESQIDIDYVIPLTFWSDSSYTYIQDGTGAMFTYRSIDDNDVGFQLNIGLSFPLTLTKEKRSSDYSRDYDLRNGVDYWTVCNLFFGPVFRPLCTDIVDFLIVPGVGCDFTECADGSTSYAEALFGAGIDFVSVVKLTNSIDISAGMLFQYQFYSVTIDHLDNNNTYKNNRKLFSVIPRAGITITF